MKRLTLSTDNTKLKILVYGKPGAGKTTFTGSAALDERTAPVLHIDCSGNPETLLRQETMPDVIAIEKIAELTPIYEWLAGGQSKDHALVTRYGLRTGYKTVVFDGVTAIQRLSIALVSGSETLKPGEIPPQMQMQQWGSVLRQMLLFARAFLQSLPNLHVLVTALERENVDDATKAISYSPALQGQSAHELPGEALAVIRIAYKGNVNPQVAKQYATSPDIYSIAQLWPNRIAYAKDQHGFNMPFLANPTVSALLDALTERES
jgi:hypothetical protein